VLTAARPGARVARTAAAPGRGEDEAEGQQLAGFVADRVAEEVELRERDFRQGEARSGRRPRRVLDPDQILHGIGYAGSGHAFTSGVRAHRW